MGRVPYDNLAIVTAGEESAATRLFRNPDWVTIENTERPWLYACGLVGPLELQIQLAPGDAAVREYRVTLHFCELRDAADGGTFDVLLQGETVLAGLNVSEQAEGRPRPLTKQFTVRVAEQLSLQLTPQTGAPPIISAMQIKRL
jgi:hypothetical protein